MTISSTLNVLSSTTRSKAARNIETLGGNMASGRKGVTSLTAAEIAIASSKSKIVHLDKGYSASAQNGIDQIKGTLSSINTIEGYVNSALDLALSSVSGAWSDQDRANQLQPQLLQLRAAALAVYNRTLADDGTTHLLDGNTACNIPVGSGGAVISLKLSNRLFDQATQGDAIFNDVTNPGANAANIATIANAPTAVTSLQSNLVTISTTKAYLNNLIQQFEAVISSYDDDIEISSEIYNDITETDMAESASQMQQQMSAIDVAGFIDAAANKIKQAQINTAQRIMAGG